MKNLTSLVIDNMTKNVIVLTYDHFGHTGNFWINNLKKCGCNVKTIGWQVDSGGIGRDVYIERDKIIKYDFLKTIIDSFGFDEYIYFELESAVRMDDLENIKFPKIWITADAHLNLENFLKRSRKFDYSFVSQKETENEAKRLNINNIIYLPFAGDPYIYRKIDNEIKYDFGFLGNFNIPHYKKRYDMINKLKEKFSVKISSGRIVPDDKVSEFYSDCLFAFNCTEDITIPMRFFEIPLMKKILFTDEINNMRELIPENKGIVYYNNFVDLVNKTIFIKNNKQIRQKIENDGYEYNINRNTYKNRIEKVFEIIFQ